VKLKFSGAPQIAASQERAWRRLIDPRFVASSVPGVESVQVIDSHHFTVISGFGIGFIKARLRLDGELFDIAPGTSAKMRLAGSGPGLSVEVLSDIAVAKAGPGKVQLNWSATSRLGGPVANVGAGVIEMIGRRLTEQFWEDFGRRVVEG
jgi:hypothetical protein